MVFVRVFNRAGQLVGPVELPKLELSDDEWRRRLSPEQFRILRSSGTERPFCGLLLDNKQAGVYACAGCGLPLFSSAAKFHSGTGWPSFFQPIAAENVAERPDESHGMVRVEIRCARCDGHLGHVFPDGPPPTRLRYCLNSESLRFVPAPDVASLAETEGRRDGEMEDRMTKTAVLAGGCFWCTEAAFEQLEGVLDVTSGYTGGTSETANYPAVCGGDTGHAEAIRITYDPEKITYEQLLEVFFDAHDPTQLNRQGNDIGTQYRSAIFYADEEERRAAQAKIDALHRSGRFAQPIVTALEPLGVFYPAEDYHQDYARNNPDQPYIQAVSQPKVCKVREKHARLIRR